MPHDVFISYSHRDLSAAQRLQQQLEAAGLAVFIDTTGLRSGDRWLDKLQAALAECQAFIVLVGAEGVQRWVGAEVNAALVRHHGPADDAARLPIHPLLLPAASPDRLPPFLALFQADAWQPGQPLPPGLVPALQARQPQQVQQPLLTGCPFVGLASYRRDQAHLYFGRRAEVLQALACLGDQQQRGPEAAAGAATGDGYWRWLQVEGHSGSGKSSLVHAGLLPLVEAGALWPRTGLADWRILGPMLPGQRPAERLAELLEHWLQPLAPQRDLAARHQQLLAQPRALAQALRGARQPGQGLLLVVDQFEELYTFAEPAERDAFDRQLAGALADADCPLFVVSTVRSDFLDRMEQALPQLAALYNRCCKPFRLPPMAEAGLRQAIEQPARLAGLDVSEVLAPLLGEAEGEPGALPLVAHALRVLWADAGGGRRLRGDDLRRRQGLAGMLSAEADALLARIDRELAPGGRQAALELLLALTHPGPEGRHTRRRITRAAAAEAACPADPARGERVLRLLAGERSLDRPSDAPGDTLRLVTTGTERGPGGDQAFADLIHETLLRRRPGGPPAAPYWPALFEYVEAHKHRPALLQELERDRLQFDAAPPLARWRLVPHRQRLAEYAALPLAPRSAQAGFLARCRRAWWGQVAGAGALVLALGSWGVASNWDWFREAPFMAYNTAAFAGLQLAWWAGAEPPLPVAVQLAPMPAGQAFVMGCVPARDLTPGMKQCPHDEPQRPLDSLDGCAMAQTEVTNRQFARYIWAKAGGFGWNQLAKHSGNGRFGTPDRPVVNVSFGDANAYAKWLSGQTGQTWRLPTEGEWEYAARGPQGSGPYPWGKEAPAGRANCSDCGDGYSGEATAPVASYAAVHGLHDMAGNVWEWTASRYDESDESPEAARVLRGGSWGHYAGSLRAADRFDFPPMFRDYYFGFRLCRSSPIESPATVRLPAEPPSR